MNKLFAYIVTAIVGILIAYSTDAFTTQSVQAIPKVEPITFIKPDLPVRLNIDLNTGKFDISGTPSTRDIEVTVENPTKIVEKVVEKPIVKKEVKYETKTEIVERAVIFTLPTPAIHIPQPQVHNKVMSY